MDPGWIGPGPGLEAQIRGLARPPGHRTMPACTAAYWGHAFHGTVAQIQALFSTSRLGAFNSTVRHTSHPPPSPTCHPPPFPPTSYPAGGLLGMHAKAAELIAQRKLDDTFYIVDLGNVLRMLKVNIPVPGEKWEHTHEHQHATAPHRACMSPPLCRAAAALACAQGGIPPARRAQRPLRCARRDGRSCGVVASLTQSTPLWGDGRASSSCADHHAGGPPLSTPPRPLLLPPRPLRSRHGHGPEN